MASSKGKTLSINVRNSDKEVERMRNARKEREQVNSMLSRGYANTQKGPKQPKKGHNSEYLLSPKSQIPPQFESNKHEEQET